MKSLSRFLLFALALMSYGAHASPVATTAGSNLIAYNPGFGATDNNNWNTLTNPRGGGGAAPTADFGNCNALIMRCAQPKCKSGGCKDMNVTSAIVTGCINSNATCKQYGADLVNYISGQLVAQSTAQANQAAAAAQNAAAQQNNQQMEKMAETISALQQQISENNENMQAALEAQQQSIATQIASATANTAQPTYVAASVPASVASNATDSSELTATQRASAESGVPEDLILRADISGEILTKIQNAENNLETLKQAMETAFTYAGCDDRGDDCTGPKRVKKFKDLAGEFFDPYEDVLDDLYEAILLSQTVGVDVSNIYMMLNNSCDRWAKYACAKPMTTYKDKVSGKDIYAWPRYNENNCKYNKSVHNAPIEECVQYGTGGCLWWKSAGYGSVRGGMECAPGQIIPPEDDTSCTMIEILSGNAEDDVARGYLYPDEGDMGDMVRVGCASNALKGSWLFRGRKQQASINIETLRRIVEQDSAQISFRSKNDLGQREQLKYCALTESGYMNLQKYVGLRGLPTKDICINERALNRNMDRVYIGESDSIIEMARNACTAKGSGAAFSEHLYTCYCRDVNDKNVNTDCDLTKSLAALTAAEKRVCGQFGAKYAGICDCDDAPFEEDRIRCKMRFNRPDTTPASTPGASGSGKISLPASCIFLGGSYDLDKCCSDRGGFTVSSLCRCGISGDIMGTYDKCFGGIRTSNFYSK